MTTTQDNYIEPKSYEDKALAEFDKEFNNGKASFWFTDEECYAVKEFLTQSLQQQRTELIKEVKENIFPKASFTGDDYENGWNTCLQVLEERLNNLK